MRARRIRPVALLVLAPVIASALAACDGSGFDPQADASGSVTAEPTAPETTASIPTAPSSPSQSASTASASPSSSVSSAPAKPVPPACELVGAAEVSQAFGYEFGVGRPTPSPASCTFTDAGKVTAVVAASDHQPCTAPPEDGTIVEPLTEVAGATRGWWVVSDVPPLRSELRACTAGARLEVHLSYVGDYDNDPRSDSISLAEKLLQKLR